MDFFSSLITPHSIFVTHRSSLITYHSSLKIPQLPTPHPFGTITQFVITQYFSTVCESHTYHLVRAKLFCYPRKVFIPIFFSFLISPSPFNPVTLPKHKPKPIKISRLSPMNNTHLSNVYRRRYFLRRDPAAQTSIKKRDPFPHFVMENLH